MKFIRILLTLVLLLGVFIPMMNADSATVINGQSVEISVTADGTRPFTYQWYVVKGEPATILTIGGATQDILSIPSAMVSDSGTYYCVVSNTAGSTTSDSAVLTVNPFIEAPSNARTHTITSGAGHATIQKTNTSGYVVTPFVDYSKSPAFRVTPRGSVIRIFL